MPPPPSSSRSAGAPTSPSRSVGAPPDAPEVLTAVVPDRAKVVVILHLLAEPARAELRADLAGELVRFASRYEDVLERAVRPALADLARGGGPSSERAGEELAHLDAQVAAARQALAAMWGRIRHVKPMNAATDDPVGFDRDLDEAARILGAQVGAERDGWWTCLDALDTASRVELAAAVEHAAAHASTHPHPPRTPVGRVVAAIEVGLSGPLDSSTVARPGRERMAEELDRRGIGTETDARRPPG